MDLELQHLVAVAAFVDPAGRPKPGSLKKVRARSAVVVVGLTPDGLVAVLHASASRCSTPQLLAEMYKVHDVWHPRPLGVESNAMQLLFADIAEYIAREFHGKQLPIVPVYQPTNQEKQFRVRSVLQPLLGHRRLLVRPDMVDLIAELRTFPRGTVDLADALASAVTLLPKVAPRRRELDEREEYAAFLREQGLPPSEIESRLVEAYPST